MNYFLFGALLFILGFAAGWWRRLAAESAGERAVRRALADRFQSVEAHLLNSVTLPCSDGSTQVDHILISTRGVFVIESKHYSGWIFADEKSARWTQVLHRVRRQFQNPLRQNFKHCSEVRRILDFLPPEHVHSAVVFTGTAEFKRGAPAGVYDLPGLLRYIESVPEHAISGNRVQFCVGRLECHRFALTGETDVQHQTNLTNRFGLRTRR